MQIKPKRPPRRVRMSATGRQVRENVGRIRKGRGMTQVDLAAALLATDRPLGVSAINEIENGARRVDVDDLTALAVALGVNPNALLMPPYQGTDADCELSGLGTVGSLRAWEWAKGRQPLEPDASFLAFHKRIEPQTIWTDEQRHDLRRSWKSQKISGFREQQEEERGMPIPDDPLDAILERLDRQIAEVEALDPTNDGDWQPSFDPAPRFDAPEIGDR